MTLAEYSDTVDDILHCPESFKVCCQCHAISYSAARVCRNCKGYRWDESPLSVYKTARLMLHKALRGEIFHVDP